MGLQSSMPKEKLVSSEAEAEGKVMRREGNFVQGFVSDKGEKRRLLPQTCPVCAPIILRVCL